MSVLKEKLKQYEGKIDDAIKQAKLSASDEARVRQMYAAIKAKNPAKYVPFLIKNYKEQDVYELINTFETSTHKVQNKDINSYTIDALRDALKISSNTKTRREIKSEGAKLVFENDKVRVYHMLSKDAACLYGSNTTWCTSAEVNNYFDYHHMIGNLYYILSKYREPSDPLFKMAVLVTATGSKHLYDAPQSKHGDGYTGSAADKMLADEGIPL